MDIVDDHSRALTAIRAGTGPTTGLALEAVFAGGATWGLPAMVLSDNGTCFAGVDRAGPRLNRCSPQPGSELSTPGPITPETCGKVERFHATLKRWLTKQPAADSLWDLQGQLDGFAHHFNYERRSSAGGELTPAERHHHSTAAGPSHKPIPLPAGAPKITITARRSAPTAPSASPAGSPASAPNTPADPSPSSATAPRPSSSTEPPSSPAPTSTPTAATSPAGDRTADPAGSPR